MAKLENRPLDALAIGDHASLSRVLQAADIVRFARLCGDINPLHLDPAAAREAHFNGVIGHGMWTAALISAVLGTRLPGPGTIYLGQSLQFHRPVYPGDRLTARVEVRSVDAERDRVVLACAVRNQHEVCVLSGDAEVLAPRAARSWTVPTGLDPEPP